MRTKIKNAEDSHFRRAQHWIMKDKEICGGLLKSIKAYEESWHEMKELFDNDTSTHEYLRGQGFARSSEMQETFRQLSTEVMQKWGAMKFDPQNKAKMRDGTVQAISEVRQYMQDPYAERSFSTITLFLDYAEITKLQAEYSKENKKTPPVQSLMEQIASALKADAVPIQRVAEVFYNGGL